MTATTAVLGPSRLLLATAAVLASVAGDGAGRRACNVVVGIDEPLYDLYDKNMTALTALVGEHFGQVNEIYRRSVFADHYEDVYFRVARIQVMFGSCASFKYENCTENRSKFLEMFDQYDFTQFCLAYMFTYRDFHNGTAGLANIGTVCRPTQNSGFVTFLNYGQNRSEEDSVFTLAHELGHSLGAVHDEAVEDKECGSNYIMAGVLNETFTTEFSNCSVSTIRSKLESVDCLEDVQEGEKDFEVALCGNFIVEPGEECDCGPEQESCNDPCCYPAHIGRTERLANDSALPCSRTERSRCLQPASLVYGVYLPWAAIGVIVVLTAVLLHHDWIRDKRFFRHVTGGNIRIVRRPSQV